MGYSTSLGTIEDRRQFLGPLMRNEPASWSCPRGEEGTYAYQVRECLDIARKNPQAYPDLTMAARRMKVQILGPGAFQAVIRRDDSLVTVQVGQPDIPSSPEEKYSNVNQVVDKWTKHEGDTLRFPETSLSNADLRKLHAWAVEQELLIFYAAPAITIKKYDSELAEFAFNPKEDL